MLVDGLLAAHLTRGGRTLTLFDPPPGLGHEDVVPLVVAALERAIGRNMAGRIVIEKVGDDAVIGSEWANLLRSAGARIAPKGVRIGGAGAGPSGSGSAGARA